MIQIRKLVEDMAERRLLPVAVILLVALVAVPVLLGKGADPTAPAAAPAPTAATVPGTPVAGGTGQEISVVTVTEDGEVVGSGRGLGRLGKRNPFKQRNVVVKVAPAEPDTGASSSGGGVTDTGTASDGGSGSPADSSGSAGSGGSGGTGGFGSGGTGGSDPSPGSRPTPDDADGPPPEPTYEIRSVDLRFGPSDDLKPFNDFPALAALPNARSPLVIFLGFTEDGKRAVFLPSAEATVIGDGACKPSRKSCQRLYMRPGERVLLEVTEDDASVTRFELVVKGISIIETTSEEKAIRAQVRAAGSSRTARRVARLLAGAARFEDPFERIARAIEAAPVSGGPAGPDGSAEAAAPEDPASPEPVPAPPEDPASPEPVPAPPAG